MEVEMDPFYAAFADRLQTMMRGLDEALTGLPPAALDWSPGPELNTLGVLAIHTAGATRFWIGEMAGADGSNRVRAQEFASRGQDAAALRARLDEVLAHSLGVLARLTPADLGAERTHPQSGQTCTVAWALLHALDHLSEHVGHAQMTRQLWLGRQPGSDQA
jgi:uncharacterized damage-inducible protein DinB